MLNRYAAAILGSIGTATVLASYVVMYNDGQGVITLGLLGFALIGSAMLTQRVRDLACQVEDLEDLERDYNESVEQTQRYMRMANLRLRQVEDLEWELASAKLAAEDWKHIFGMANDGAFDA